MLLLDLILLIILVYYGVVKGIRKGFVMELSGLVGIIVALYLAKNYSVEIAGWFGSTFDIEAATSPVVAFVLTMVLALVGVHFLAIIISKFLNVMMLGWLNKLLGAVFSFVKVLLVLSAMIHSFDIFNSKVEILSEETLNQSRLYYPIKIVADTVLPAFNLEDIVKNWKEFSDKKETSDSPSADAMVMVGVRE